MGSGTSRSYYCHDEILGWVFSTPRSGGAVLCNTAEELVYVCLLYITCNV